MAHLEGSIVPQRALGGRAQAKLRGQLPEAASDARELVGSRARPAQVVDWRSPDAVQVHKPHEEGAVCVQKRREMRRVEPGCMLPDLPHDTAHALIALPDGARWGPRSGWSYFCRSRGTHGTILTRIRAKTIPYSVRDRRYGHTGFDWEFKFPFQPRDLGPPLPQQPHALQERRGFLSYSAQLKFALCDLGFAVFAHHAGLDIIIDKGFVAWPP
jgi:hypothetical protein